MTRFCLDFIDSQDVEIGEKIFQVLSKAPDAVIQKAAANASRRDSEK